MSSATVTCHVELPLDDRVWAEFARIQAARPGGFAISALIRPPDSECGESSSVWLERARSAAARAPLGHHSHFGGPLQARPSIVDVPERVRAEAAWFRENGLHP